ncbi:argininosuccinate lyase [Lentibacter sp. XHP0401]|jgi:hypothetical protein|uniref:argininosuccinate lyase n=1 Tax=Lentibacter sp. XHP0401 TaxID=2984334 RepID=UPI0021E6EB85|nr:argininosuccinate lyase [Lentibacter sp. XHP0401]MCV2894119.1 argininosuccinate lyase [Lentibacter sp. XHP0401]
MTRFIVVGMSLMMLAGCGAEGKPVRPEAETVRPQTGAPAGGLTVSGHATVGVIYN